MIYSSWAKQTEIGNFRSFFALYPSKKPQNEKIYWRYYHFTHVHQKSQSYDLWFLRYGVQQTDFFVILGHFLLFYHPNSPKNQNFKKLKKYLEISSFYTSVSKIMIICYTVPETWCVTDVIVIFHSELFFALLHPPPSLL